MPEVQVERGESPREKRATLVCGPKLGEKKEIPRMQDKRRDNAFRAKKKLIGVPASGARHRRRAPQEKYKFTCCLLALLVQKYKYWHACERRSP